MPVPLGMPEPQQSKTVMRSLGEFFGHIVKGVRTDPAAPPAREEGPARTVVREETHEETSETPEGKMILRRTIIEEVELRRDEKPDGRKKK